MSQTACISQYYQAQSQIGFARNYLEVEDDGIDTLTIVADKPFVPIAGITLNGGGYKERAILGEQILYGGDTMQALFDDCYTASIQKVDGILSQPQIADGSFDQYLYKKLFGSASNLNSYQWQRDLICNFLRSLDPGWTAAQFNEAMEKFALNTVQDFRRDLFIAPGTYTFSKTLNQFGIEYTAWFTANATLVGIEAVELVSI